MNFKEIHICFFIGILFFIPTFSFSQWESIGAGTTESQTTYFGLSVVDENIVWGVPIKSNFGTPGTFYTKTVNGGQQWEGGIITEDTIGAYYALNIKALNENLAWAVLVNVPEQEHARIYKTEDGGNTWINQPGEFNQQGHAFANLHFFNENEGVAFGSPGTGNPAIDSLQIFRTADGGDHWNRIPPSTLPFPFPGEGNWAFSGNNAYEVKGDTIWFVTRASRVFRSIDKGLTWEAFNVSIFGSGNNMGLASIAFENATTGILVHGSFRKGVKTTDGGETWSDIDIPNSFLFGAIEYIPGTENTYLLNGGYNGEPEFLLTKDGGATWEELPLTPSIDCFEFYSPTVGFGGGRVNLSNDEGLYRWIGNLGDSTATSTNDWLVLDNQIEIFPNPVADFLSIKIQDRNLQNTITLEVVTTNGKVIQKEKYLAPSTIDLNTSHFPKGVYLLKVMDGNRVYFQKFIKQ